MNRSDFVHLFVGIILTSSCMRALGQVPDCGPDLVYQITGADSEVGDQFGTTMAADRNHLVVTAPLDNDVGAAFVFTTDDPPVQVAKLVAPVPDPTDGFGSSVAVAGDLVFVGVTGDDEFALNAGSIHIYRQNGQGGWDFEQKVGAADPQSGTGFGSAIAVIGNMMFVGAPASDDRGTASGALHVFRRDGDQWTQTQRIVVDDLETRDHFGAVLAAGENHVFVAARGDDDTGDDAGAVYVFVDRGDGLWIQLDKLTPLADPGSKLFGWSIAVHENLMVIGAILGGSVPGGDAHIYRQVEPNRWEFEDRVLPSDGEPEDNFGVAAAVVGERVVVGSLRGGGIYVYQQQGDASWTQTDQLSVPDGVFPEEFGTAMSVSRGIVFVADALGAQDFRATGTVWGMRLRCASAPGCDAIESEKIYGELGSFGETVEVAGSMAAIGATNADGRTAFAGAVYIRVKDENRDWVQSAKIFASDDTPPGEFGRSISIDGGDLVVGDREAAYVFRRTGEQTWSEVAKLTPSDGGGEFGRSVAMSGSLVAVAAVGRSTSGGAVYLFEEDNDGTWNEIAILVSPEGTRDTFGGSVAFSEDSILVGAPSADATFGNSGAVFVFRNNGLGWVAVDRFGPVDGVSEGFGWILAASDRNAFVSAPTGRGGGRVFVFRRSAGGSWRQIDSHAQSVQGQDFGESLAIAGDTAVIGMRDHAFIYRDNGQGRWSEIASIETFDGASGNRFGAAVGISQSSVIVGAFEDDDLGVRAGAAYAFELDCVRACRGDFTTSSDRANPGYRVRDGQIDAEDFFFFLDMFAAQDPLADLTGSSDPRDPTYGDPNGEVGADDFFFFLDLFSRGCARPQINSR